MKHEVLTIRDNNRVVASALREAAGLLEQQDASPFRVLAYLKAADAIEQLEEDIGQVATRGMAALEALPHIGPNLAAAIMELATTGRWSQLDRIRGALEPEAAFQTIPGIGPALAHRLHDHLQVDTMEGLEAAAHDGRLAAVPGVGRRRAASIRASLSTMLSRRRPLMAGRDFTDDDRRDSEKVVIISQSLAQRNLALEPVVVVGDPLDAAVASELDADRFVGHRGVETHARLQRC